MSVTLQHDLCEINPLRFRRSDSFRQTLFGGARSAVGGLDEGIALAHGRPQIRRLLLDLGKLGGNPGDVFKRPLEWLVQLLKVDVLRDYVAGLAARSAIWMVAPCKRVQRADQWLTCFPMARAVVPESRI